MGGLRKYMPITAGAFIVAWLAIAGMPRSRASGRRTRSSPRRSLTSDYALWVVGVVGAAAHRVLHDPPGVARLLRQRALARVGPRRGDGTPALEHDPRGRRHALADRRVRRRAASRRPLEHDPHESPRTMTMPLVVLAVLAAVGGLLSLPFHGLEFLTEWLEPVFEDVPEIHAELVRRAASLLVDALGDGRSDRHRRRPTRFYRNGLDAGRTRIPSSSGSASSAELFGHAYYFDDGDRPLRRRPAHPRGATWLDRRSTRKVIDGAVNGVGPALPRGWAAGCARLQTGLVRNYALGIVVGAVGCSSLSYDAWSSMRQRPWHRRVTDFDRGSSSLTDAHRSRPPSARPSRCSCPARRPELARAVGYIATVATARLRRLPAVALRDRARRGYQFVEHHDWIGDLGVRTSSASTASACSWWR